MLKKLTGILICLFTAAVVLAGCGAASPAKSAASSAQQTTTAAAATTAQPTTTKDAATTKADLTKAYLDWGKAEWDAASSDQKDACVLKVVQEMMGYTDDAMKKADKTTMQSSIDMMKTSIDQIYTAGGDNITMSGIITMVKNMTNTTISEATANEVQNSKYLSWKAADWSKATDAEKKECALAMTKYVAYMKGIDPSLYTVDSLGSGISDTVVQLEKAFTSKGMESYTLKEILDAGITTASK